MTEPDKNSPASEPEPQAAVAEGAEAPAKDKKGKKGDKAKGGNKLKAFLDGLKPRERMILKFAGLAFVILMADLVIMRPVNGQLTAINTRIHEEEAMMPHKIKILQYEDRIRSEYEALKPFRTSSAITQEEEIGQFLKEIEKVSTQVNLFITNVETVEVRKKEGEPAYELAVNISGTGTLVQATDFMIVLEKDNPPFLIEAFTLKSVGKESDDVKYQFTIVKLGIRESDETAA